MPALATYEQAVSPENVAKVSLTGLSFTDWDELVLVHDDRHVFQASPEGLPVIDIHSL